jgi:hypothetical protein
MKRILRPLVLLLIVGVVLGAAGCKLLHVKVIEIVLKHSTCMDFVEYEVTANWADPLEVYLGEEIDDALDDADLSRDDIVEAKMLGASYEVTDNVEHMGHDWILSGGILITYGAMTETIVKYTDQSVRDAMGGKTYADLRQGGVDLLNDALFDYYENHMNPMVTFTLTNEAAEGDGGESVSEADPLDFTWLGCMKMYIIVEEDLEVVDPS